MKEFDNNLEKKFKFDFSEPCISNVSVERLKEFLDKDSEAVLVFYGGEPLLQIEKIKEVIDKIDVPFRMQTNGILLDKIPSKYMNKIDKILISIDGDKSLTEKNRGRGTYDKILKNIQHIKKNGYRGEIVARMTIAQDCPDVYEQVLSLIKVGFTSVHWQLDVGFYGHDFDKETIRKFFKSYNKSVSKLLGYWVREIEKGNVLKLYPFLAIVDSLLKKESTQIRCGAGHSGYAITTSGKVVACPIMNSIEDFKAGDMNSDPDKLAKFNLSECEDCGEFTLCGGRCMYWRKASLWPKEGDEMICDSIRFYLGKIKMALPRIQKAIEEGIIKEKDFEYEKYFGPEIIP